MGQLPITVGNWGPFKQMVLEQLASQLKEVIIVSPSYAVIIVFICKLFNYEGKYLHLYFINNISYEAPFHVFLPFSPLALFFLLYWKFRKLFIVMINKYFFCICHLTYRSCFIKRYFRFFFLVRHLWVLFPVRSQVIPIP